MLEKIKTILGIGQSVDYTELGKKGATILDVRSRGEYAAGHIAGSVNISVDTLADNLQKLKGKEVPIITCCASGMRSAQAKRILESNGFSKVHNGRNWQQLQKQMI